MIDEVAAIIRQVGTDQVLARFRELEANDISEKAPGDYVTTADKECERILSAELRAVRDLPVVGEEATAADPGLIGQIDSADAVWLVDPVDGTANFVAGSTDFAVMVALVEYGQTRAAWIWHPDTDRMVTAELGAGTWCDGMRLERRPPPSAPASSPAAPRGVLKHRYVPEPARTAVRKIADGVEPIPDRGCAGLEYLDLVDGADNLLFYWRTLPWDHAPGTLIATEAGLRAQRLDATPYQPGDDRRGLLTAPPAVWPLLGPPLQAACNQTQSIDQTKPD